MYTVKVKVSPLQAMMAQGGCECKVHIYTATAQGRSRVASPLFGPRESLRYSFYRRLSKALNQSAHKEVKKNILPSDTRAAQPIVKRLAT